MWNALMSPLGESRKQMIDNTCDATQCTCESEGIFFLGIDDRVRLSQEGEHTPFI